MKTSKSNFQSYYKGLIIPMFIGILFALIYFPGCDAIQQTNYLGSIEGWVYDDSTRTPLPLVKITCCEFMDSVMTDYEGRFFLKNLSMGTNEHVFQLKFEKQGYKPNLANLRCLLNDTLRYDTIPLKQGISGYKK